jgi:hypothetical protein
MSDKSEPTAMPAQPGRAGRPHVETRTTRPRRTVRYSGRFTPETWAIVKAIAAAREGLSDGKVIENAIELYGKKVLGRRMADLVPPKVLPGRRRRST